jgi:hypothetical protein
MTARRRRKSGSGPSATALIAWVGGAQTGISATTGASASMIRGEVSRRIPGSRAVLVGRACGLAAGTLLACGSVLAGATHVGDGSLAGESAPLLNHIPTVPGIGSAAPDEARDEESVERTSAAPNSVSAQVVADASPAFRPQRGQIRRNRPASLDVPSEPGMQSHTAPRPWGSAPPKTGGAPSGPIAPVNPVLDPATKGVGRVAPVGGVLEPTNPREVRARSPRDEQATSSPAGRRGTSTIDAVAPVTDVVPVTEAVARVTKAASPVTKAVVPVPRTVAPPLDNVTQPAMTMLTSLLPMG